MVWRNAISFLSNGYPHRSARIGPPCGRRPVPRAGRDRNRRPNAGVATGAVGVGDMDGYGRVSRALSRRYSPYRPAAWSRASISGRVRAR
jgi:hypothetical protein